MSSRKIEYRPEIDGLRAISVIAVILFHFNASWLRGGFVGVDVFFVISGYLITSIIMAELDAGSFAFTGFWGRRIRRIFPALSVMVIIVLLLAFLLGLPSLTREVGKEALAAISGLGNYRMKTLTSNYWGANVEWIPMLHTWSLGIEEQFYLFFPVTLFLLHRYFNKTRVAYFLFLALCTSLVWCVWQMSAAMSSAAFFMMLPRGWELLAGAILVFIKPSADSRWLSSYGWVANIGLLVVLVSLFTVNYAQGFPWPGAFLPVAGAALFILFSGGSNAATWMTSRPNIVLVGKASYSLYLWHWPCLVFGTFLASACEHSSLRVIGLLLGLACGWASFLYIEPLGKKQKYIRTYAPVALLAASGLSALAVFKTPVFDLQGGYPKTTWQGAKYDTRTDAGLIEVALGAARASPAPAEVILLGDSHALSLAPALDQILLEHGKVGRVYASGGTRITNWNITRHDMNTADRLMHEKMREQAVVTSQPRLIIMDARWETFDTAIGLETVKALVLRMHELSPRSTILIVAQPPHFGIADSGDAKMYEWLNLRLRLGLKSTNLPVLVNQAFIDAHIYLKSLCRELPYTKFIPVDDLFPVVDGRASVIYQNSVLYEDDDHVSVTGANLIIKKLEPLLVPVEK